MKRNLYQLFVALCVCAAGQVHGQNISNSNLQWNSVSTFEGHVGIATNELSTVTSSSDSITWRSKDGIMILSLSILEPVGSWANVSHDGSVIFKIDNDGKRGNAFFKRDDDDITIRITFNDEEEFKIYELKITTIVTL